MMRQWEPERDLTPSDALDLIQEQFPEFSSSKIRLLGAGWDNTAFVVDEKWIFRFPRRSISVPLLEAEWCILPKLTPRLSLSVPIPKYRGSPSSKFPWLFVGYPMLPGFTACHANLSEKEREDLAPSIARFLSQVHKTPESILAGCHIAGDNQGRIDPHHLIPKIKKIFDELELLGLLENRKRLESLINSLAHLRPSMSSLVHGDFYVRHLLLNDSRQLIGVIDWGDIHQGDPAIDLSIAHAFLPACSHAKFRQVYGEISDETWSLALLRAVFSSGMLILFGHHSKDPTLLREGLRGLKYYAE